MIVRSSEAKSWIRIVVRQADSPPPLRRRHPSWIQPVVQPPRRGLYRKIKRSNNIFGFSEQFKIPSSFPEADNVPPDLGNGQPWN
jgi:hypothetical protein